MNRIGKSALLLFLLVVTGLLGWLNWHLLESPVAVQPVEPKRNGDLLNVLAAPVAPTGDADFAVSETMARPVFSPTRRPPVKKIAKKKAPPPKPVVKKAPAPPVDEGHKASEFSLLGILKSGAKPGAVLIQAPSEPDGIWLFEGADIDGWRVESVEADAATISRSGTSHVLNLYVDKPVR